MASGNDQPESEPIDVEFTPADAPDSRKKEKSSGPGWVGLISAGILAALGGGAIGVVASGTEGRYAQQAEVALDISKLEEFDRGLTNQLNGLRDSLRETDSRLNAALESISTGDATNAEELGAISTELDRLKGRYFALLGITDEGAPAEVQPEANPDEPQVEEGETPDETLPRPEITLAALMERLNAIEAVEPGGQATPQELSRTVASLQERADQLEQADRDFADVIEARTELLTELDAALETVEGGLTALSERTDSLGAAQEQDVEALAGLTADVNALRESINEGLASLAAVELKEDDQEVVRRADRVLALSALDAAIDDGGGFLTELEMLAVQMPTNANITALRRLADKETPDIQSLRNELIKLKPLVAKAGIPAQPSGGWAWVTDLFSGVVSMREEGTSSGETASQKVQAAIDYLENKDLGAAIRAVKPVTGEQGKLLAPWIEEAEERQTLDRLFTRLRTDVMQGETDQ